MPDNVYQQIAERIANARSVTVLTGAGVSAESGVATFRDAGGLWQKFSPQELASMDGFLANPQRVRDWYQYRRDVIANTQPNAGHKALAEIERRVSMFTLITQNVDRLHQQAGSTNVLEVHGNLVENRCNSCGWLTSAEESPLECPTCSGIMRPNVVWFGEQLPHDVYQRAEHASRECDVFLTIGTSAEVYPVAELPYMAKTYGAFVVEINPSATSFTPYAHTAIHEPSGVALPKILSQL